VQTPPTADTGRRPPLTLTQVLILGGVVVGLLIMLDFNRRLGEAQRLVNSATQVGAEVARLETEHAVLATQVAYATTDKAVIDWAHESGKLVQPGEVLVVPVIPTPLATPPPPAAARPAPPAPVTLWWNLFFGAGGAPLQ
jgi:hypothetical protein